MASFLDYQIIFPIWQWIILGLIAYGVYWFFTKSSNANEPKFKAIPMDVETKKHIQNLYDIFYENCDKNLSSGLTRLGFVKGYVPIHWNSTLTLTENAKANGLEKNGEKIKVEGKDMLILKRRGLGWIALLLSKLGWGWTYIIVDKDYLTMTPNELVINPNVTPTMIFDVIVYSTLARAYVEDISYKVNREQE